MTCPSITELCASNAAEIFREHLASCARCRALVGRSRFEEGELCEGPIARPNRPAVGPRPGGVWTIWAPAVEQYLVAAVLEVNEDEALILPLLPWMTGPSEADIELNPEVLGYAAIAPIWASDHILVEQAIEAVDVLSEDWLATLGQAYDAFFAGEPVGAETGVPILGDDDPRLEAQAAIADELRPWYSPWSMLQGAEQLGPVMEQRRDELGVELESFSENVGVESKVWREFETGNSDPFADVSVPAMAKAIHGLGLFASQRVISLAHASVVANNEGQGLNNAPALARRRRGSTRKKERDPEVVRAAADSYASSLAKELGL